MNTPRRFLCIGDIHIKPDNVVEIELLLKEIKRIYNLTQPTDIVLLGDVLHTHEKILTQCLLRALDFISECTKLTEKLGKTYVIVGNHDMINSSLFLTDYHWMHVLKGKEGLVIVDKVICEDNIIFCPYVPPGRFSEALSTCVLDKDRVYEKDELLSKKLIFCHQEFKGCSMNNIISEGGDEVKSSLKDIQIISGHIHDNQTIGNIYYPGAPLQHSFGDSEKRVVCVAEEGKKVIEYPLQGIPKKIVVKTSLEDIKEQNIEKMLNEGSKIKVKLDVNTNDEFKLFKETQDYKNLTENGVVFQVVSRITRPAAECQVGQENLTRGFTEHLEMLVRGDDIHVNNLYEEIILEELTINYN